MTDRELITAAAKQIAFLTSSVGQLAKNLSPVAEPGAATDRGVETVLDVFLPILTGLEAIVEEMELPEGGPPSVLRELRARFKDKQKLMCGFDDFVTG